MKKTILDLCGGTGSWSKPYSEEGYDVRLITLPDFDVRNYEPPDNVYGILAAPPCTMFSFARMNPKYGERDLAEAMDIVKACLNIIWQVQARKQATTLKVTTLKFWALENPNGFLKYFLGHSSYSFDPWEFGDMYSKRTHLWGWFNRPIKTWDIKPQSGKFGYSNVSRWASTDIRSLTPKGFAQAFFEANR